MDKENGNKRLSDDAIALLRAATARALSIPEGFDMAWWVENASDITENQVIELMAGGNPNLDVDDLGLLDHIVLPKPPCGTVGCLVFELGVAAGNAPADMLDIIDAQGYNVAGYGAGLLGLNVYDGDVMRDFNALIHGNSWPREIHDAYDAAEPFTEGRALALRDAVEAWIAGDGSFRVRAEPIEVSGPPVSETLIKDRR